MFPLEIYIYFNLVWILNTLNSNKKFLDNVIVNVTKNDQGVFTVIDTSFRALQKLLN